MASTAKSESLSVRFWGVRGSIASPGRDMQGVGGNTSCVEVRFGEQVIVLDAGTGIRALGDQLMRDRISQATLLLSHLHWDHIQGLPFFLPAWLPGSRLEIVGAPSTASPQIGLRESLSMQMQPPHFPVRLSDMGAHLSFRQVESGQEITIGEMTITARRLNHPGGVMGYRIEAGGRSIVYATDTEHYACLDPYLVKLAKDADVLIYDSMYTEAEYRGEVGPSKVGWGHSTWEQGVRVADAARVGQLVLFHHDPQRTDREVAALEMQADILRPGTIAAREGLEIALPARRLAAAA
ncbi:MAG: MBL fold metallo-hydrolase [Deltaproteobacteria bacterium]|nr:MBL fold metallo-hydrolase [Deltaproteobacteria bacterium]